MIAAGPETLIPFDQFASKDPKLCNWLDLDWSTSALSTRVELSAAADSGESSKSSTRHIKKLLMILNSKTEKVGIFTPI